MLFHHTGLAAAKRKAEKDALGTAKRPKGKAKAKGKAEVKVEPAVKTEAHCPLNARFLEIKNETLVFNSLCLGNL